MRSEDYPENDCAAMPVFTRAGVRALSLPDHEPLHGAAEIAADVRKPRGGEPGAIRTDPGFRIEQDPFGVHHSGGSTASSYSFLNRAINSAAGRILATLP